MALTTPDPNTALIIFDLQKGIVALPVIHSSDYLSARQFGRFNGGNKLERS